MQRLDLVHHVLVDRKAARGIDQQHVGEILLRRVDRTLGDRDRVLIARARMEQHVDLLGQRAQLLDRRRTVDVGADHHDLFLLALLEELGELRHRRRLARALQAGHQHDRRRRRGKIEVGVDRAHHRGQLVAHDLDQGLTRGEALHHVLADRAHLDALDQRLHHRQRHVRFEQGDAHFAQGFADIRLGQARAATQALDGGGKALA